MNTIDSIQVTLNAGGMNTINIVLAFVMYGVALGIKPHIFVEVFKKPKSVLLGILCQLVLLPALTCALAILLTGWISPMMGLGMILVAACPGGNISNFMSSLAKANIELSVSLTAISTALAVFLTPFNFWLWGSIYLHSAAVSAEIPTLVIPLWDVFKTIFILLGIPLGLGILTSRYLPKVAKQCEIKHRFIYYSARKTFTQIANELMIKDSIIEYCIGDAVSNDRKVIGSYIRVNKRMADAAIRKVFDAVASKKTMDQLVEEYTG